MHALDVELVETHQLPENTRVLRESNCYSPTFLSSVTPTKGIDAKHIGSLCSPHDEDCHNHRQEVKMLMSSIRKNINPR